MNEPFLDSRDSAKCGDGCCSVLFCCCSGGRRGGCGRLTAFMCVFTVAFWLGITRNLYYNPESLSNVEPPLGGELLPEKLLLVERKYLWIQFTKLVDVYTENMTHLGYFYDINLLVIMRFGFSDPQGRIWFEARYASFLSRFKPIIEYNLQRCDAGGIGRPSYLYQLKEVWWSETYWKCLFRCERLFNLAKRPEKAQVREQLLPELDFGEHADVRVRFDGWMTATIRGKISGPVDRLGTGFRQLWSMNIVNQTDGTEIANASQHFVTGPVDQDMAVLSRWKVLQGKKSQLPTWVIAFLAALDDIEED